MYGVGFGQWRELLPVYACVDVGNGVSCCPSMHTWIWAWLEVLLVYAHVELGNGMRCGLRSCLCMCMCMHVCTGGLSMARASIHNRHTRTTYDGVRN